MKYLVPISFLFLSWLAPLAHGNASESERLNRVIAAAIEAIYGDCCIDKTAAEKQAMVREVIEAEYDLDVIIRRAIGRSWRLMAIDEQDRVLELVKQLVVKAYVKGMNGKERPLVEVGEAVPISEKRMEIPSTVLLEGQALNILYRLGRMQSGWQIYDIVTEDISVVSNYREQIDDHFRKGTGEELIVKLEELLSKEDIDENIRI